MKPTNFRGTVLPPAVIETELAVLADLYPVGSRIRLLSNGRLGTVHFDQPPHVPGVFDGRPTAVCFTDVDLGEAMVCANWDHMGFDVYLAWKPVAGIQRLRGAR